MSTRLSFTRLFLFTGLLVAFAVVTGCDSTGLEEDDEPDPPTETNDSPTAAVSISSSTVDVGTEVTLDGSGSSDPDGDDLTYSWSLDTPGGSNASLSDASAVQPTFMADVEGDYTATLEVDDGDASDTEDGTVSAETVVTEINSNITSDQMWTADNTYRVTSTVDIRDQSTLTIEPGTQVQFADDVALEVLSGSALVADGTSSEPITMTATPGDEQQGWWKGVAFFSNNANNTLNHVELRHAASSSITTSIDVAAGVAIGNSASLTLANTTIAESENYGLYSKNDNGFQSFSENTFSDNAEGPMWIAFGDIGSIDSGTTFDDGTAVRAYGDRLNNDATVTPLSGNTPYQISGNGEIDATLTVEPGVEMTFESNVSLEVFSGSALVADGTSSEPITMTATPGDEQQGWWKGIAFFSNNADNTLNHVELRHAARSSITTSIDVAAGVAIGNTATLNITNTTIAESGNYGLYSKNDNGFESFSENTFSGNAEGPMWIAFGDIGSIDSGTTFDDGTAVRAYGDRLNNDATVTPLSGDTPYQISGQGEINATLTVEPGVDMTFESNVSLEVFSGSALVADGTSSEPITMTATPGDEQQGWWKGIAFFSNNADNTLNHVEIRHGGSENITTGLDEAANVALGGTDTQLDLTNSTITDSGNHGVFCQNSSSNLSASGNSFSNNAGQDVVSNCQ